ncbi:MAG: O-antigen ligase family protein, partial [Actinomycetota bacterium]
MRTWILDRYQVYGRVALMAAIFVSPVIFNRKTQDVFNLVKFTVLVVATLVALALYVIWASERAVWMPRFNLGWFAGAFLGACLLATVFSASPILSLVGLYHRYGGFLPFLLYAIMMFVIVGLYWEKPQDLKEIARASVAASMVLAGYVLIQAAGADWIPWKDSTGNAPPFPVGTMGNSNFAGGYLGIAVPFVAYVAAAAKSYGMRTALFVFLGLDLLALWFTQTRGGMIAAGAGLLAMVFLYRDKIPRWFRMSTLVSAVAAAVLAVLILFHPGTSRPIGPLADVEAFRTGTFSVRTYYWGTALRIFKDNPIVGTGLDVYYANYPKYRLPQDGAQLGLTITDKPHNIYVEYMANAGVLGAGAYLILVGAGLLYGYRVSKKQTETNRLLLVAFTSVLAGYLAQG